MNDAATGVAIGEASVEVRDPEGRLVYRSFSGLSSRYHISGLQPGNYLVQTEQVRDFVDERYDDLHCPGGSCSGGTLVSVSADVVTDDIDFELDRGAALRGVVTTQATGVPLVGVRVEVFDHAGSFVGSRVSTSNGEYRVEGLPAGDYFARTRGTPGLLDEVWGGDSCTDACDPSNGKLISLSPQAEVTGIDFALAVAAAAPLNAIPTLGTWGLLLFVLLLAGAALRMMN